MDFVVVQRLRKRGRDRRCSASPTRFQVDGELTETTRVIHMRALAVLQRNRKANIYFLLFRHFLHCANAPIVILLVEL